MNTRWKTVSKRLSVLMTLILLTVHIYWWLELGYVPMTNQVDFPYPGGIYILPFSIPRLADIAIGFIMTPIFVYITWLMSDQDQSVDYNDLEITIGELLTIFAWFGICIGYIMGVIYGVLSGLANIVVLPLMTVSGTLFIYFFVCKVIPWGWEWVWAYDKKGK